MATTADLLFLSTKKEKNNSPTTRVSRLRLFSFCVLAELSACENLLGKVYVRVRSYCGYAFVCPKHQSIFHTRTHPGSNATVGTVFFFSYSFAMFAGFTLFSYAVKKNDCNILKAANQFSQDQSTRGWYWRS